MGMRGERAHGHQMMLMIKRGRLSAADVQAGMPDAPSYSAVRTLLRILEEKGHVRHEPDGPRYVYIPTVAPDKARRSALMHVVNTFFDGSASQVMAAGVTTSDGQEGIRAFIEKRHADFTLPPQAGVVDL